jgi:hypothetical protein
MPIAAVTTFPGLIKDRYVYHPKVIHPFRKEFLSGTGHMLIGRARGALKIVLVILVVIMLIFVITATILTLIPRIRGSL